MPDQMELTALGGRSIIMREGTMTFAEYLAAPGLSQSAMKDLEVSPMRYWYRWINPDRAVIEPTPEQRFGSAVHCAVLEPSLFDSRYACELIAPDDCLTTIEDLRMFIRACGFQPRGTRKADVVAQAQAFEDAPPIFDVLEANHNAEHAGKVIFKADDWGRIQGAAQALSEEPLIQEMLAIGNPETSLFMKDPDADVLLKGCIDWLTPDLILDLKTFTQKRGKSIDRSIADAIFYEAYYRQAYLYATLNGWPSWRGRVVMAFVESDPPHEVRLKEFRPRVGPNANVFWTRAAIEVRQLIRTYAMCRERFGDKPWKQAQEIIPLEDEDIPQLAYA